MKIQEVVCKSDCDEIHQDDTVLQELWWKYYKYYN